MERCLECMLTCAGGFGLTMVFANVCSILELRASGLLGAFEHDFFRRFEDSPDFYDCAEVGLVFSVFFGRSALAAHAAISAVCLIDHESDGHEKPFQRRDCT
jgi:hypothetical protein